MYYDKHARDTLFEKKIIVKNKLFNLKAKLIKAGVDSRAINNAYRLTHYNTVRLGEDDMRKAIEALQKVGAVSYNLRNADPRWILSKTRGFLALKSRQEAKRIREERWAQREAESQNPSGGHVTSFASPRGSSHVTSFSEKKSSSEPMRASLSRSPLVLKNSSLGNIRSSLQGLSRPNPSAFRSPGASFPRVA